MMPQFPQAFAFDCVVPDGRQVDLTARWLTPNLEAISAGLMEIRACVDRHYAGLQGETVQPDSVHLAGRTKLETYPYGYCDRIRDAVWDALSRELRGPCPPGHPFAAVAEFYRAGGLMRKIWGELTHGPYLQNAMQLGAYYVDAANDTVDVRKPKLEVKLLAETTFRNIDGFEHYFDVVDSYYEWDTYPNLHFPRLAPFFPGIAMHRTAKVWLFCDIPMPLMYKNLAQRGQLAWQFLAESKYARKTLPVAESELLGRFCRLVRPTDAHDDPRRNQLDGEIADHFRWLAAWLEQGRARSDYEQQVISLDRLRKELDWNLREYSFRPKRPGNVSD